MKEGWKYEKLRDVTEKCTNIKWQNIPSTQECYYIDLSCVNRDIKQIENPQTINSANAPSRAKQIIREGDVLFGTTRPTLQRYCLINDLYDGQICSTGFCVLRPKRNIIHPKYLYYIFSTTDFYKYIEPLQSGANYPAVTDGDVKDYVAPIPSLSEQQRIVELLDAEFAKIDSIRANADQQLRAAKDLFQVALNEMITPNLDWKEKVMRDICDVTDYVANGSFATLKENVKYHSEPNYAVLVRLADYSSNFDQSKFVYVDEHSYRFLSKSTLYGGEIIMSNVGSVGKCFICPFLGQPMTLGPNSILIRIDNSKFYMYYFRSAMFLEKLKTITNQATLSKFNKTQFRSLKIQVPDSSTQNRIVNKLDALSEKVARLQENYDKTLTLCNDLKQKLLKSIFE